MLPQETLLLEKRKAGFQQFYNELMPALVDFVGNLGIKPSHEVLKHAEQFVPYLDQALRAMTVADEHDRVWLLARVGYFIGEYFSQKHGGCWYVNEIQRSRYFGRYVVGKFSGLNNPLPMLDPFQVAESYVDIQPPRYLAKVLAEVESELIQLSKAPAT